MQRHSRPLEEAVGEEKHGLKDKILPLRAV
jgi:hypothetical protein